MFKFLSSAEYTQEKSSKIKRVLIINRHARFLKAPPQSAFHASYAYKQESIYEFVLSFQRICASKLL
jgi:hypothetical protein